MPPKTSAGDKENTTTDVGAIRNGTGNGKSLSRDKKSRSKSLGPGGLDALQDSNGNRRKVTYYNDNSPAMDSISVLDY